jgi:hypothetical protein
VPGVPNGMPAEMTMGWPVRTISFCREGTCLDVLGPLHE